MNFPLFIAQRIYSTNGYEKRVSKPAINIAMAGITIGLTVMILSISIAFGFKREIREKVIGFGSHVQIGNLNRTESYETKPILGNDSVMRLLVERVGEIKHIQRFTTKPGMLKTEDDFQGVILKGVGQEYDMSFFTNHLLEGEIPLFSDTASSNAVLISKQMADKMNLKLGDRIYTYFIQKNVRARRFEIKGIYQTNLSEFDNRFIITDIYTSNRLNNWEKNLVSGLEIAIHDFSKLEDVTYDISLQVNKQSDKHGNTYYAQNIEQIYPAIFSWLDVLDTNVSVILILMIGVAGFTMISGLLILILERTNMIGLLKVLGATDLTIRKTFLYFAVFLIGKGMLWGNIIGLSLCFLQQKTGLIRLDPTTYYVESVPTDIHFLPILLLNIFMLIISVLMLIGPSFLISRILPAKSLRFE